MDCAVRRPGCRKAVYLMHWPKISHIIACGIVLGVIGTWQCSMSMTVAGYNESCFHGSLQIPFISMSPAQSVVEGCIGLMCFDVLSD